MEEVGHAPHSSLWRQGVWIGSFYNTRGRGRSYILTNYRGKTVRERERVSARDRRVLGSIAVGQYRR